MTEMSQQSSETATEKTLEEKMQAIVERTGYTYEVTAGQRKYTGPPPGWTGANPTSGCEIYCGKIPPSVQEDELILLFEQCGTIWDMRLMVDPTTNQHKGFCFCMFADKAGAEQACKELEGHAVRPNKPLKVNISTPNCRLFMGNIPKSRSKDEILEEVGKVTDGLQDVIVYSVPDDPKKKNRGFAFLDYDTHKSAASARKRLSGGRVRIFNCDIICDWADPIEEPDSETMSKVKVLYVRNLKMDVTEEHLREAFSAYGKIEKVKKVKDYGFVHFFDRDEALSALEALNGTMINDSELLVSLAKPPTDARLKEQRKLQHMQLYNGGRGAMDMFGGGGGGGRMGGRGRQRGGMGGMSMMRNRGGMGGFGGGNYEMDYFGGGGFDYGGGYDDGYYDNYDDYYEGGYGFDDYYYGMPNSGFGLAGAPRGGRGMRGRGLAGAPMRARGSVQVPRGVSVLGSIGRGAQRGGRGSALKVIGSGRRGFGRAGGSNGGMSGGRGGGAPRGGVKRKAAGDYNQSESKKPFTQQDTWTAQPIAQQPLGQASAGYAADAGGESEWYQDSFTGQQWG